MTFQESYL